ncbi:hypothetical protein FACS1894218_1310 [Bacilli bacterium]|nr:hypothetical protein FACS1894218_1310 [Bacilli bacterium]
MEIFPGYGLTETSNLATGNAHPLDKISSVGRLFDHQEAKIVNGELWLRGENIVQEYYRDEINTNASFQDG